MLVDVVVPDGLDSEVEVLDLLKLLLGTVAVGLPLGVRADGAVPDRNVDPWIVIRPPRVRDAAVRDAAAGTRPSGTWPPTGRGSGCGPASVGLAEASPDDASTAGSDPVGW